MDKDSVHERTEGNLRLKIVTDPEPSDPREDDQLGVMVCAHPDYQLGDKNVRDWLGALERLGTKNFVRWLQAFHGTTVVLPLYLLDHSGLSMRAGGGFGDVDPGGWDTSMVGFIFDTAERREAIGTPPEHVAEVLEAEVAEYDRFLRGEAYGYVIERLVTCDQGHEHATTVESVWGFSDDDDALGDGRSVLEALVKAEQLKAEAKPCKHCGQPIVFREWRVGADWTHVQFDNLSYESQRCENGREYAEPADEAVQHVLMYEPAFPGADPAHPNERQVAVGPFPDKAAAWAAHDQITVPVDRVWTLALVPPAADSARIEN